MSEDNLFAKEEIIKASQPVNSIIGGSVYFLIQNNEIVYVGSSIRNPYLRILDHYKECKIQFDSYTYLRCPVEITRKLETAYILRYLPKHNKNLPEYKSYGLVALAAFKEEMKETLDIDKSKINKVIKKYKIRTIFHGKYARRNFLEMFMKRENLI